MYNAPPSKNVTIGHQKAVENFLKKFQLFCVRGVGVPGIRHFCGIPAQRDGVVWTKVYGRITMSSCKKKDKVLSLSEKDADVI